jgi:hypothetical protein
VTAPSPASQEDEGESQPVVEPQAAATAPQEAAAVLPDETVIQEELPPTMEGVVETPPADAVLPPDPTLVVLDASSDVEALRRHPDRRFVIRNGEVLVETQTHQTWHRRNN